MLLSYSNLDLSILAGDVVRSRFLAMPSRLSESAASSSFTDSCTGPAGWSAPVNAILFFGRDWARLCDEPARIGVTVRRIGEVLTLRASGEFARIGRG